MVQPFRSAGGHWLLAGLVAALGVSAVALAQSPPGAPAAPGIPYVDPLAGKAAEFKSSLPVGLAPVKPPAGAQFIPAGKQTSPQALPEVEALKKATVNGKYSKLLTVIRVPGNLANYGNFNDYGHYNGTEWAGYTGLPQGYWVYVHPHWFIWEQQGQVGAAAPGAGNPGQAKASVNGKYIKLLKVIDVAGDQATYGEFNDYGFWNGTEWAGHQNLPEGYWVYVAPKWYIWGEQGNQQPQPKPKPGAGNADQVKASVNGKYSELLRVINVPQDKTDYGEFKDYGHYTGTEWAGYDNLPPGYWVYVAPNWYIWGKQGATPPDPNKAAGRNPANARLSANGKYVNLLKVINVPGDQATYGDFNDYGLWTGTEWAGHQNLPQGYWVYVAPNWYIWGGLAGQQPAPPAAGVPPQASVNGKYSKLLKVIDVPGDQATYGAFNDYGHYTGTSWAGHDNLPPGYWVYVAPKWYIWGQNNQK